ncbi:GNAT family N-acetyltransferase [bacterium]|nr:GNAT family N-acetyltransferase [bacterium]
MNLSVTSPKIRLATKDDIEKIVKLVESVYRGDSSKKGWTTEADLVDGQRTDVGMISEMMNEAGNEFYVIDANKFSLAASVHLKKELDHGYIGMVSVSTDFQNQKFGKKLLFFCEEKIVSWGLAKAKMTVLNVREELIAWYVRFGYKPSGQVLDFPKDPRFGIPKVANLKLIELEKNLSKNHEK